MKNKAFILWIVIISLILSNCSYSAAIDIQSLLAQFKKEDAESRPIYCALYIVIKSKKVHEKINLLSTIALHMSDIAPDRALQIFNAILPPEVINSDNIYGIPYWPELIPLSLRLKKYKTSFEILKLIKSDKVKLLFLYEILEVLPELEKFSIQINEATKSIDKKFHVKIYTKLIELFIKKHLLQKAVKKFEQFERMFPPDITASILYKLGKAYLNTDPIKAKDFFENAYRILIKIVDTPYLVSNTLSKIAKELFNNNYVNYAEKFLITALNFPRTISTDLRDRIYFTCAINILDVKPEIAIDIGEKINSDYLKAKLYLNVAEHFRRIENPDFEIYLNKAVSLQNRLSSSQNFNLSLNIIQFLIKINELASARKQIDYILNSWKLIDNTEKLKMILSLLHKLKAHKEIKKVLNLLLPYLLKKSPFIAIEYNCEIAKFYKEINKIDIATKYLFSSLSLCMNEKLSISLLIQALCIIEETYDFKLSSEYTDKMKTSLKSLINKFGRKKNKPCIFDEKCIYQENDTQ